MRYFILIILILHFSNLISQKSFETKVIEVDDLKKIKDLVSLNKMNFSQDSINIYFEKWYNSYRTSLGLDSVFYDSSIVKVCIEQSNYCLNLGYLTHKQTTSLKEDADDRCNLYGVEFLDVNENLMMGNLQYLILINYHTNFNFYDCLSQIILEGWKLSPGHNDTLLKRGESFAVGVSLNSDNDLTACFILISNY